MTQVKLDPSRLTQCTVQELTVYGIAHYLLTGDWQTYGVLPPPELSDAPTEVTIPRIAETLRITERHAGLVWSSLITKGAIVTNG